MKYIVFFAVVIFCSVSCKRDNEPQSNINTEIPLYNIIGYSYTKYGPGIQMYKRV